MTPELVDDLKQFIEALFLQHLSGVNHRFDGIDQRLDGINHRFDGIDRRLDGHNQRFDDAELKLDTVIDTFGGMLIDHDMRISLLEGAKA